MTPLIIILGPTGAGKTEIGLHLAKKFSGEIINADSRQVYGELKIGTALPSKEQFRQIPHHLFGICPLDEIWDAARFQREADRAIAGITARQCLPFTVGGTGLYIKALLFGLFEGPARQSGLREGLYARIQKEGLSTLYAELARIDPKAADRIHPNDALRIVRALEVYHATGKPMTAHQQSHGFGKARYRRLKIGLNRDRTRLYGIINTRVESMMAQGLEDEARELYRKWGPHPLLLRSIGYAEWRDYFDGKSPKDKVTELIQQHTRNLAKRQWTWFRKEKDIVWFDGDQLTPIEKAVEDFICGQPPA